MNSFKPCSNHAKVNQIVDRILVELCPFLEEQDECIRELTAIAQALGSPGNLSGFLYRILSLARRFANADGGSLYLVDASGQELVFHVIQNDSLNIANRRIDSGFTRLPNVKLFNPDKSRNLSNVSSFVWHTGEIINIEDVYETDKFQFSGTREFDRALDYRSRSMLVIPMRNHESAIIGVLQLINAMDPDTRSIVLFNEDSIQKAGALAAQAAVMITQQALIDEMEELFEAFIRAIAVSIDEKSKHTGGHIQRVTDISLMIADCINSDTTVFKDTHLTDEAVKALRMASLMHDTGKITTPDHVINKSTKLETIFDRVELIEARLEIFRHRNQGDPAHRTLIDHIPGIIEMIRALNNNRMPVTPDHIRKLEALKAQTIEVMGVQKALITEEEFENLCIPRGNLTEQERMIINHHAELTTRILKKLPWPEKFSDIPYIAGAHHEKLDGSGYPEGLNKDQLTLSARILAIADIFEALSARDRPYKAPISLTRTLDILDKMARDGLVDTDIVQVFIQSKFPVEYAQKHLLPSQLGNG